jgi:hypothetical protein
MTWHHLVLADARGIGWPAPDRRWRRRGNCGRSAAFVGTDPTGSAALAASIVVIGASGDSASTLRVRSFGNVA